jgi:hypothetical protein
MDKRYLLMRIEGAEHTADCHCGDCGWVFEEYSEA